MNAIKKTLLDKTRFAAVIAGCFCAGRIYAAPAIAFTAPTQGTVFSAPASIKLTVNVTDSTGTVTNVSYYQGATKLADVAVSPFSYTWSPVNAGSYAIQAVAADNTGAMATSSVVNITVSNMTSAQIMQQIKTVFMISMENRNFTQPNPTNGTAQILGNPAAPYINSLVTPGNSNSAQTAYATACYNVGIGVHPSEPNYVWAEAGTDFGVHTDNDPSQSSGNVFTVPHLVTQMNTAGVPWRNYQEDVEYSASPTNSSYGSAPPTNYFNGTHQFGYAVKHNPMAFFSDTQTQNVVSLTNIFGDLASNTVARYNWITPDICNDGHDIINGFTYHGVSYSGDAACVAQGDNFLSILIPKIMASQAYKDHGAIILWWDETEGGDNTNYAMTKIVISPLAKGNAYASSLPMSHSSDVKSMEEIFNLPFLTNAIPSGEVTAFGSGYNNVATVNDFSDMFQAVIPGASTNATPLTVLSSKYISGAGFQVTFTGPTGTNYHIFAASAANASSNSWTTLTNGTFAGSNVAFLDAAATNHYARFYSIKSP